MCINQAVPSLCEMRSSGSVHFWTKQFSNETFFFKKKKKIEQYNEVYYGKSCSMAVMKFESWDEKIVSSITLPTIFINQWACHCNLIVWVLSLYLHPISLETMLSLIFGSFCLLTYQKWKTKNIFQMWVNLPCWKYHHCIGDISNALPETIKTWQV